MSVQEIKNNIEELKTRDSHIAVGIIDKMGDGNFDNEERSYFCFLEAYYLSRRES